MYPYRIRITDPDAINAFKKVSKYRITRINPSLSKSIGHKIPRSIKRDGVFVKDGRFGIDNPKIVLTFEPAYGKRSGYDFCFKTVFNKML